MEEKIIEIIKNHENMQPDSCVYEADAAKEIVFFVHTHYMEFINWLFTERAKDLPTNDIEDTFNYWLTNIKNK